MIWLMQQALYNTGIGVMQETGLPYFIYRTDDQPFGRIEVVGS